MFVCDEKVYKEMGEDDLDVFGILHQVPRHC
jgi:hypothetical protein